MNFEKEMQLALDVIFSNLQAIEESRAQKSKRSTEKVGGKPRKSSAPARVTASCDQEKSSMQKRRGTMSD